jgi:ACS family pantothenate transporter-like MFS transporter
MLYSLVVQAIGNNVMPLWMASRGYSVIQQNNYPTIVHGMGIVATFAYCYISDKVQSRYGCSLAIGFTFIFCSAILVSDPGPDWAYFLAFYLLGTTYAPQALWYTWMADLTGHDLQLRAITTGFMNSFDFAFVTWWPLVFFPVTDAPNYRRGYIASLVTGCLTIPVIYTIARLERRGRREGTIGRGLVDEGYESPEHQDWDHTPWTTAVGSSMPNGAARTAEQIARKSTIATVIPGTAV